ncbi:acyltransferase family protein [Sanguibacter gelidistatuariae]|uniref:acyltransferase family protein n=1 Tax=Sanguibacter gelidistatuariae TaxID=1814289 RepID=UPI001C316679|nr:acyltransferase family protein [Sanguibacter gelidistatuariae]
MSGAPSLLRRPARAPQARASPVFLPEVQALRAIAVTGVVVYHLWPGLLPAGFIGVDVFFVISGYLISSHMMSERARTGRFDLGAFYVRRVRRILPAASLVVAVTALLGLAVLPELRWGELTRQGTASLLYVQNWVLAGDSVDYLAQGVASSPFQHYWSLSIEEQFYILWPVAFLLAARRVARTVAQVRRVVLVIVVAATVVSFAWSVLLTTRGDPSAYFVSHSRFWELGLGAVLALSLGRPAGALLRGVAAWAGLALIAAGMVLVPIEGFPGVLALVPTVGAALVIWAARAGSTAGLRRAVSVRGVQWLGDVSYSLYLWHWPLVVCVPFVLVGWGRLAQGMVVLVLSLALAGVTRKVVEVPLQRRVRPGATRTQVLVTAAAVTVVCLLAVQLPRAVADSRTSDRDRAAAALLADPPADLGAGSISADGFSTFASGHAVVVPSPESARAELPDGADGRCKSDMAADRAPVCHFGPEGAETVIALVGDSHIEQYLPTFQAVAAREGVRIVTYFHSSCPFSTAQRATDAARGGPCLRSNDATTEALLADPTIDLVVTSGRSAVDWVVSPGVPSPADGFAEAWTELTDAGLPVVVLSDNPLMLPDDATSDCVLEHLDDPGVCARVVTDAMPVDHQIEAAALSDVDLVDTSSWFCTVTVCPAVIGSVLVYRDAQHITPAYARTLESRAWDAIQPVLVRQ